MDFRIGKYDNEEYILPDTIDSDPSCLQDEYSPEANEPMVRVKYEYDGIDQVSSNFLGETKVPFELLLTPNVSPTSLSSLITIEHSSVDELASDFKLENNEVQNQVLREMKTVTEISMKKDNPISSNDVNVNNTTTSLNNFGVKLCLAPYCNFTGNKNGKIQLHDMPLDQHLQKQWFNSLTQAHTKLGSLFLVDPLREKQSVCSRHFTKQDFRTYFTWKTPSEEISTRILLEKAVPSIYYDSKEFPFCDDSVNPNDEAVKIKNLTRYERELLRKGKSISVPPMEESYTKNDISGANPNVIHIDYPRPPLTIVILNALALLNRRGRGMLRAEINGWIVENFPFFKTAKTLLNWSCFRRKAFFKQIDKTSQGWSVWSINGKQKGRLLKLIEKQCLKNKNAVRKAMSNPDALELMMKGEFKKVQQLADYSVLYD